MHRTRGDHPMQPDNSQATMFEQDDARTKKGGKKAAGGPPPPKGGPKGKAAAAAASGDDRERSVLAGVPVALPALLRSFRIGEKAAKAGFDWPDRSGPRQKVDEELRELDEAIARGSAAAIADELGDVLFSLCNLARHLGVNPEMALGGTTDKFQRRFQAVEAELGYQLAGRSLAEMDAAWNRAKSSERRDAPPA